MQLSNNEDASFFLCKFRVHLMKHLITFALIDMPLIFSTSFIWQTWLIFITILKKCKQERFINDITYYFLITGIWFRNAVYFTYVTKIGTLYILYNYFPILFTNWINFYEQLKTIYLWNLMFYLIFFLNIGMCFCITSYLYV